MAGKSATRRRLDRASSQCARAGPFASGATPRPRRAPPDGDPRERVRRSTEKAHWLGTISPNSRRFRPYAMTIKSSPPPKYWHRPAKFWAVRFPRPGQISLRPRWRSVRIHLAPPDSPPKAKRFPVSKNHSTVRAPSEPRDRVRRFLGLSYQRRVASKTPCLPVGPARS